MPRLLLPSCYPKDLLLHYIFCLFHSFIYALGSSLVSCPVFLTTCSVVIRCLLCRVRFLKIWAFLFHTWYTKSWNKTPCPTWEAAGSPVCQPHLLLPSSSQCVPSSTERGRTKNSSSQQCYILVELQYKYCAYIFPPGKTVFLLASLK